MTPVETTVRYGKNLFIIETTSGIGLFVLNKLPVATLTAKSKTVTTTAVICVEPSGISLCV